ncbi:MAG: hypothetical protein U0K37_03705 [Acutalibacteraceae bacterium]|nr:hypothetical protein [Acutalibacteraceae bacterium]
MDYMTKLQEAMNDMMNGNDLKALPIMQEIIHTIETDDAYKAEEGKTPVAFDEEFEYLLYSVREDTEDLQWIREPISLIYVFTATLHMNLGDLDAAIANLEKAMKWNPVSAKAQLAMAEAYALKHDQDKFYKYTMAAFPNIFHSEELGQAYRNLGAYYADKDVVPASISCYGMSMLYEQSEDALNGLAALQKKHPEKTHMPTDDELLALSKEYGFPITPDPDVLTTACLQVEAARAQGDEEHAKRFLDIIYDLKQGEAFKKFEENSKKNEEK